MAQNNWLIDKLERGMEWLVQNVFIGGESGFFLWWMQHALAIIILLVVLAVLVDLYLNGSMKRLYLFCRRLFGFDKKTPQEVIRRKIEL